MKKSTIVRRKVSENKEVSSIQEPSTPRRRDLKTQQSSVILDLCLKKLGQENRTIIVMSSILKRCVFKMFSVHTSTKSAPAVSEFLWFEERFRKAPFSLRISVEVGLTLRPSGDVALIYRSAAH